MIELRIDTERQEQFVEITGPIQEAIVGAGLRDGVCTAFCPHTTAGLTINEHADPSVMDDMSQALDRAVPSDGPWRHLEGNSPAHAKAMLVGPSVQVIVEDGKLILGRWQGIFFCEFDGPRERRIWLHGAS